MSATQPTAQGRDVYLRHCASCHGQQGEGQPDWYIMRADGSLTAPPHDSSGHTWHHSDAELFDIVSKGGAVITPKSGMPGYGAVLSQLEIAAVIEHMKTMWGPEERAYQMERTQDWSRMMKQGEPPSAP